MLTLPGPLTPMTTPQNARVPLRRPSTAPETSAESAMSSQPQAHVQAVVLRARTSFFWAMRLLPRDKREAMFAVYAFCREVDDIADGDAPFEAKRTALAEWRREIGRLMAGGPTHPVTRALAGPVRRFVLPEDAFLAVLDGMEMDAAGGMVAPSLAELRLYCARVAGAVGRLSVRIFGVAGPDGEALASALGEAVQLTNVLRDIDEDAHLGRLYLPRELLVAHGVPITTPDAMLAHPGLPRVCKILADMAEERFAAAAALIGRGQRRALRPARVMMEVYRRILARLRERGFERLGERVRLGRAEKLWVALRYGLL